METNEEHVAHAGTVPAPVKPKVRKKKSKPKSRRSRAAKPAPKAYSEPTAARAAKLAVNLVEFEKTTFDSAVKLIGSLNDRSEKAVRHALSNASWLPREGQKLVEEWQHTVRKSLKEFARTVDKSFDLLSKYLARIEAETPKSKK